MSAGLTSGEWFGLSDPAMEEALHDVPLYREFARLEGATERLPDGMARKQLLEMLG